MVAAADHDQLRNGLFQNLRVMLITADGRML
jgi:hypothetical protein